MFSHAHNFKITNSTFNYSENQDSVSALLHQHVASGALIDSSERFPPGKCHPGTRERMIQKINDWIHQPSPANDVLWLYGPAGSGKSALAQSIAEDLREHHPEMYGGSFFFARGPADRGRGDMLFSTLAYQLALQIPPMRKAINDALARDPILPTKSINYQLEHLIIGPAQLCAEEWPLRKPTVFIDGLDECGEMEQGPDTQCAILALISEALVKHHLPIRFFVSSRPEFWIRDSFEIGSMKGVAYHVSLRDDVDADQDMKRYLRDGFEEIRLKNIRVMRSVEPPWPPVRIVDRIVEEASGQYIYASTVLKFIGKASRYCDPQEQLRILTTPGPHRASAFSDLDKLYATVLSAYPRPQTLLRVLGGLLANASLCTIRVCLGVEETEITLVLDALSSLTNVSGPELEEDVVRHLEPIFGSPLEEVQITFCHLSFPEFLQDEHRSGPFFVDVRMYRELIGCKLLGIIENNLKGRYETEPHIIHNLGLSMFNKMMRNLDALSSCGDDVLIRLLTDATRKIQHFLPVLYIRYPACLMRDMDFLDRLTIEILYRRGEKPGRRLSSISSELSKTAALALMSARNVLCDSEGFKVTPTLVRIDISRHIGDTGRMDAYRLFHDTGGDTVEDTLSSLRMHRHIIDTEYFLHSGEWFRDLKMFGLTLMHSIQHYKDDMHGWLSREEWDNAYVLVLYRYLRYLLKEAVGDNFGQIQSINNLLLSKDSIDFLFRVNSEEVFRRSKKGPIFQLLTDCSVRARLLELHSQTNQFSYTVQGLLSWLHSEMTNPIEQKYIHDCHAGLPAKIIATIKDLFEQFFPPENLISTPFLFCDQSSSRYRVIEFLKPLENNGEPVIVEHDILSDRGPSNHTFKRHHELYQTLFESASANEPRTVMEPISDFYPRLATFALRALVMHQASLSPSKHEDGGFHDRYDKYIFPDDIKPDSYVSRCISYALPTPQNLASLRALRYLDAISTTQNTWRPPAGFSEAIGSVLKKYTQSDLSSRELESLKEWTNTLVDRRGQVECSIFES